MNRDQSAPFRLALLFAVVGALTIGVTWYGSGDEASSATQLPYVIVAVGAGLGSVVVAALLYTTGRLRVAQRRLVEAARDQRGDRA